ncbi:MULTISPECIES: oligopeptide/dipeptide ABC transporter ATP-binding protein [Streptomyces]|uniref:oligopeptide/dipeptide ABC transporter ATP-binding protein n=1 Tax=Streptomyces TaxID=1883 RepID=UPI00240DF267|nr:MULTISPECIES: oligopeptide/dipeptide ABC transporter ATP-binding protein [Streptomyces]WFB85011.1 ATP-binding cassette domain-containing protein [Streptomyces olivaceus]WGK49367.1 ATP-binding cassette domain-containing protein [Streptomyces sp. B146]
MSEAGEVRRTHEGSRRAGLALYDVTVRHHGPYGPITAVDGVSLEVARGGTVGLVGESGSGKSTLARAIVGLDRPSGGRITVGGREYPARRAAERRRWGRQVQLVFQDPDTALDPRMTVRQSLAEAAGAFTRLDRRGRERRIAQLLKLVGLDAGCAGRLPGQLSGGQRQRVAVARALAVDPAVLVADEVTSALDGSVRASLLGMLRDLQRRMGFAMLFISHDLAAVRRVSDTVAVMYLGRIVETVPADALPDGTRHPYTRTLLSAVPSLHGGRRPAGEPLPLSGEAPDPASPPTGCRFHPRCPVGPSRRPGRDVCAVQDPWHESARVACHFPYPAGDGADHAYGARPDADGT